jgi:hypothetical protein
MPTKTVTVNEPEALLLAELKRMPGCENALQVTTIPRANGDWICGPIRAGTADIGKCRAALVTIEKRARDMYRLKETFR